MGDAPILRRHHPAPLLQPFHDLNRIEGPVCFDHSVQIVGDRLGRNAGCSARLFAAGVVREEQSSPEGGIRLLVDLPQAELQRFAAQPGVSLESSAAFDQPHAS